jgi:hypothetical protein
VPASPPTGHRWPPRLSPVSCPGMSPGIGGRGEGIMVSALLKVLVSVASCHGGSEWLTEVLFCFCSAGVWTWGLTLAWQVLYHLSHFTRPGLKFLFGLRCFWSLVWILAFWDWVSLRIQDVLELMWTRPASKLGSSCLHPWSAGITGVHHCPQLGLVWGFCCG